MPIATRPISNTRRRPPSQAAPAKARALAPSFVRHYHSRTSASSRTRKRPRFPDECVGSTTIATGSVRVPERSSADPAHPSK